MIRVFRVFVPASVLVLLISEAFLIFFSYITAAYYIFTQIDPEVFLMYDNGLARISLASLVIILGLYFNDLYGVVRVRSRIVLAQQISLSVGGAFLVQALMSYANGDLVLPKWLMIYGSALAFALVFGLRLVYTRVVVANLGAERVLFIGASPVVFETAEYLDRHPELGMSVIGYLDEDGEGSSEAAVRGQSGGGAATSVQESTTIRRLGVIEDLKAVVGQTRPGRIVVGMRERRRRLPVNELLELRFAGITTEEIAHLYEAAFTRVCAREIRPSHLVFSTDLGPRPHQVQIQTVYSFVIAIAVTLVTLPVMAITAVLVRLSSSGPILFRQTRVGLHDQNFTLYKFRSMHADAEARTGAVWAMKDDPRVTPVGRWLRLLRLDELPQLFNVLRGEMSIVGPRPERPEFVKTLSDQIPYYRQRHCVKPGITGWAQVSYKYANTMEDAVMKLEYDLYYIKNMSVSLDLYIIFHTIKTMLLFRGAH